MPEEGFVSPSLPGRWRRDSGVGGKSPIEQREYSAGYMAIFHTLLALLRLPSIEFRKRIAAINEHGHANTGDLAEFPRCEHRDANAAVTGRVSGNRRVAVNGYAVIDIIRVVEQTELTFSPAFYLAMDIEPARRSDRLPPLPAFSKKLAGTR